MANFTIYRDSWRRGGDSDELLALGLGFTTLYTSRNGMMCCLGQCSFEIGVPLEALESLSEPFEVYSELHPVLATSGLLNDDDEGNWRQSSFSNCAMTINDDATITDALREKMLIELGAKYGHTITFVDGIAPWFAEDINA